MLPSPRTYWLIGLWLVSAVLGLAIAGCGSPPERAASPTALSATTALPAETTTASAPPGDGPALSACQLLAHVANATAQDVFQRHGATGSCDNGPPIILSVPGSATGDSRPGYLVCERPQDASGQYCGFDSGEPPDTGHSYLQNWDFYPFPVDDAVRVGLAVWPQEYQCIGNATQLWTFHLDTYTYTPGCHVIDFSKLQHVPCDSFLYSPSAATHPLLEEHGKADACGTFGDTVVGVLDGKPQPGLVACSAPRSSDPDAVFNFCGLGVEQSAATDHWQFVALPVAAGPVDAATFDTAAGTACVTVGAQSFTFTLATRSVTDGCAGSPAAIATAAP